jgi:hypothetical protein
MTCERVRNSLWAHLDGCLPEAERRGVSSHLAGCRDCSLVSDKLKRFHGALKDLPVFEPPEELGIKLRVMASRERQRMLARKHLLQNVRDWLRLWPAELMRPVALPLAGGLLSAVLLFAILVPSIYLRQNPAIRDVPTVLFTQATVKSGAPFGFNDDDFVVEVIVDGQGRMVDYWIAQGPSVKNIELRRRIENYLLFTEFTPATAFGQPTYARMFLAFSRKEINVKS